MSQHSQEDDLNDLEGSFQLGVSGKSNGENQEQKKYSNIPIKTRLTFIKKVLSRKCTIKEASKEFNIKFSTAKAILQTFKKEGRIGKKKTRLRREKQQKALEISKVSDPIVEQVQKRKKRTNQKPEDLQEVIKQMENELGENNTEEKVDHVKQETTPQSSQMLQIMMLQQQLNMYQIQNQMLQQQISSNNPMIAEIQRELQNQRQINLQLLNILQRQQGMGPQQSQVNDFYNPAGRQQTYNQHCFQQPTIPSVKNFGIIREETDQQNYVTPMQSIKNFEKFGFNPSQSLSFTNLDQKGTWRDFQ